MEKPTILHVKKPWGYFDQFALNEVCTVKLISCSPGQQLSLQRHRHRNELWVALDNGVLIDLDGKIITPDRNTETWIPAGSLHRLRCAADVSHPVRVMEISFGHFDENDIERLEDVYGRI